MQVNRLLFDRRRFLGTSLTAGSGLAAVLSPRRLGAEPRKPNFLVIVADDMGYSDAGCYGGEISTPHLDQLAAQGIRFTQGYGTGRCWPSRASILSGYYA
ncbi:MAG: sulfatase-like hydrolase/transferase, partial [Candidatus Zipacnadales bacterium]